MRVLERNFSRIIPGSFNWLLINSCISFLVVLCLDAPFTAVSFGEGLTLNSYIYIIGKKSHLNMIVIL